VVEGGFGEDLPKTRTKVRSIKGGNAAKWWYKKGFKLTTDGYQVPKFAQTTDPTTRATKADKKNRSGEDVEKIDPNSERGKNSPKLVIKYQSFHSGGQIWADLTTRPTKPRKRRIN
jgi:hypothetical protein